MPMSATGAGAQRDLRIDFFRGLALIFIFVDHIPGNRLADLTLRNFGRRQLSGGLPCEERSPASEIGNAVVPDERIGKDEDLPFV